MKSYNGFTPEQRMQELYWLKEQYASGARVRPTLCDACGQTEGIIENHSEDYSQPFGDHTGSYAFCYRCHMMIHCRFKALHAWNTYRDMVSAGYQFPPLHTRNFRAITDFLNNPHNQETFERKREARTHTVLDTIHSSVAQ
jgi:hypothetical protein